MSAFLVYLFCLVVGFVFVLGSAVLGHFGGGDHGHVGGSGGHAEAGADSSDAPGVSLFSTTILGHLGGDHGHVGGSGGRAEAGADSSDAPGVSLFSPIIMAAFVASFGAFGL